MQTSRYLLSNRTNILLNEAGYITEYRPVYTRHLTAYKGIDNVLEFRLLNADQKPVNMDIYTPKFVAFDENKNLILEKDCTILQEPSDSTTITKKGLFKVTITENDLLNVKDQYLSYNIYLVDNVGDKVLTYSNEWFGAEGVIKVSGDAFPGPLGTLEVSTFIENMGLPGVDDSVWYSESVDAQAVLNGNEALHTIAVYTDNYVGNLTVQATLDNLVDGNTDWADITTLVFTGSETEPKFANFNGVYSFLRFKASSDPANKITKILVRN